MTPFIVSLLTGALIGGAVQYRRNVMALRRKIAALIAEWDELWEFVAVIEPEVLPDLDA